MRTIDEATKPAVTPSTAEESRLVAEQARETEWAGKGFLRDLFLGRFQVGFIHPFPVVEERPEFERFYREMADFLRTHVDPAAIDAERRVSPKVIDGLRRLGAFGIKIPKEYGGLGLSVSEYCKVMELVGSHDANVDAPCSRRISRSACPSRSSSSAHPSRRRSTCPAARRAPSPPSPSPSATWAPIPPA